MSGTTFPPSQEVQHQQLSARVPDHVAQGVFSTGAVVLNGHHEFIPDFLLRMTGLTAWRLASCCHLRWGPDDFRGPREPGQLRDTVRPRSPAPQPLTTHPPTQPTPQELYETWAGGRDDQRDLRQAVMVGTPAPSSRWISYDLLSPLVGRGPGLPGCPQLPAFWNRCPLVGPVPAGKGEAARQHNSSRGNPANR
ncbi:MAG: hypothetical protein Ct9H300mP1_30910 [Planctomycetaceae bacterium]|nr:MAG: hypothetical protein Ct9H300mP1_30910 [Planctomycetaceae bacterium]